MTWKQHSFANCRRCAVLAAKATVDDSDLSQLLSAEVLAKAEAGRDRPRSDRVGGTLRVRFCGDSSSPQPSPRKRGEGAHRIPCAISSYFPPSATVLRLFLLPILPVRDEVVDHGGIGQGRGVAERAG